MTVRLLGTVPEWLTARWRADLPEQLEPVDAHLPMTCWQDGPQCADAEHKAD